MKFLKYILGILAVLLIGFLLLGLIKSEVSYDCEIMVDKPIAESWAVTQDETKMSEWLEGFQKVEHVSGTPGTVGAVSNVYFINEGEEMTIQETITEIKSNESVAMTFTSDFMNMDYKLNMVSVDGKTKISSNTTAEGNGIFSKSIMALMTNSIKSQEETNLVNLKKVIESNTKNYVDEMEANTQNKVDKTVSEMWNNYIESNPEFKDEDLPESDFFHNNREDALRLAELTIAGKKQASSGLYSLYQQYKVDLPKVGTKQIVTDFDGKAKAIIETKKVDTIPFHKISKDYAALDMGTDIEPLKKWKKAHWDFFENFLKESGEKPTEDMLIVCVWFETIWTEKH